MNENKINVILFDFDGTLANTIPLILRSFRATWERVFGFVYDDSQYIKTVGMLLPKAMRLLTEQALAESRIAPPEDFFGRLTADAPEGPPDARSCYLDAKCSELTEVYRAFNHQWHDEMIEPFAGVEETLNDLESLGYRLGVVSSKMRAGVRRGLDAYRMAGRFEVVIGGDDCENHKPHPEPLLRALEAMDASTDEALYVGDSTHDILAGRAARVRTAAATWGPFPRVELEGLGPDYLLDRPADLLAILTR
jgi:pyrophosphatase PpaX